MRDVTQIVDGWHLHPAAHELSRGDDTRRIEPKVMQVLLLLAARPGAVVSRAELLDSVWGGFVGDDVLSAAVIKLRKAFGDNARSPRVIETVHKSGYRLIAGVCDTSAPLPAQRPPGVTVATILRYAFRMDLSESSDPEEWKHEADRVAEAVGAIIRDHGGLAIRESDAIVGVFGAPAAQEHHAIRAVDAATAIQHAWEIRVSGRMAIASGQILWAEGPYGSPVQRVADLVAAARPGEIRLSPETLDLTPGWNGRPPLTPLVGRDREISQLVALIEAARSGRGQVVAVCGEPGSGKSRLVREALQRLPFDDCTTAVASASPLEARTPFHPLRRCLMERLRIEPEHLSDAEALRRHLSGASDPSALLAVLRPEYDEDGWRRLSFDDRRHRSLAALTDALVDSERLTVLVFEDLQWADEPTLSFITSVVTTVARRPILVLVTYRPGFADPWTAKSYSTQLRVDPLRNAESREILDLLVGEDPSVGPWKDEVVARSDGTPLFAEEVVRSALASGILRGDSVLTLADGSGTVEIPASIHAVVGERLGKLTDDARHILSLAAVIGSDVPADLLEALASDAVADTRRCLQELQAAEFLYDAGFRREPAYVFKHSLTQEVAYRAMPQSRRRLHHRRIADLLESGGLAMVQVSPELIARHRAGAGQHALAVQAWVRAAHAANTAAAFADALDHLEQARSALAHTDPAERDRLDLAIALSSGSALVQSVGPADGDVERTYEHARSLAAAAGTPRERFEAGWGLWFVHLMRGDVTKAQPLAGELLALSDDLDDALQLEAHHMQWAGLSLAGDVPGVLRHADVAVAHYEPARHHWLTYSYGGHDPGVCALNLSAMALWLADEPELARERCTSAVALGARLGHPYTLLEASNAALTIALLERDSSSLLRHSQAIDDLVRDGKLPAEASAYADGYRANALLIDGDVEAGVRLMDSAAPTWQAFWGAWCFPLDTAFASALALAGDTERALTHLAQRLAVAAESGAHWWNAEFHRVRGELSGDPAEFQAAAEWARRQGAKYLERRAFQ